MALEVVKNNFLGLGKELSKKGIESIVFDGRAHGKSGGEFCTYGFKEKKDIAQIVDKIKGEKSKSTNWHLGKFFRWSNCNSGFRIR